MSKKRNKKAADVIQLFGRDEMNLVEIPFGPITKTDVKTLEVDHETFDKQLGRYVTRKMLMTGTDAFGLPQPIDDQVVVGLKALTCKAKFKSRRIEFSRYQLCKEIGWATDGRSYRRLEESLDRIASTTLKFKDAWWDKGENVWKSKTFQLIGSVQLCSRDEFDRARINKHKTKQGYQLCSFEWSEVVWKSFTDGYIKKLDMEMFRRVSSGRSKEVAVRLYRVLDKRLYKKQTCTFELERLCKGIIGLSDSYCPSEMKRVLRRAADWLIECEFIAEMKTQPNRKTGVDEVIFRKASIGRKLDTVTGTIEIPRAKRRLLEQFDAMPREQREKLLAAALGYCRTHHPEQVEGYFRNESRQGEPSRAYLEMIIRSYFPGKRSVLQREECW